MTYNFELNFIYLCLPLVLRSLGVGGCYSFFDFGCAFAIALVDLANIP